MWCEQAIDTKFNLIEDSIMATKRKLQTARETWRSATILVSLICHCFSVSVARFWLCHSPGLLLPSLWLQLAFSSIRSLSSHYSSISVTSLPIRLSLFTLSTLSLTSLGPVFHYLLSHSCFLCSVDSESRRALSLSLLWRSLQIQKIVLKLNPYWQYQWKVLLPPSSWNIVGIGASSTNFPPHGCFICEHANSRF